jgi:hypothetical protein
LSFSWTCYSVYFFRNWFEVSGKWILVHHWLLDRTSLLHRGLLAVLAEVILLRRLWWQLRQVLVPTLSFAKIILAQSTWFHNISCKARLNSTWLLFVIMF